MSAEEEVRRASEQYYAALARLLSGDAGPLMEIWSHSSDITTMNPYGGREVGREQIQTVFERVAQLCSGSQITTLGIRDRLIRVGGDLAYEIGIEFGEGKGSSLDSRPLLNIASPTSIGVKRKGGRWFTAIPISTRKKRKKCPAVCTPHRAW